jgi:phospholipid/cholesterol/gamma-HCH transport system substrate-binding protein
MTSDTGSRIALWVAVGSLSLTAACGFRGLHDVPLPGGAATGDDAYVITVEFPDVLDLVPQSSVKVNNVTVGVVEKVELDDWHARVRLRVSGSVELPGNALAQIRQTSILGEKYVALTAPPEGEAHGVLTDGMVIPLARSGHSAEIEEVLSALSALLNGGGVAHLNTITVELNNALEGREDRVGSLLTELDTFLGGLDGQRSEIVRALEGLDGLARTLEREKETIGDAVDELPDGLEVLAGQRRNLTTMLTAVSQLGVVGAEVIESSRDDLVANLRHLEPILGRLNEAGADLPNALELLTTYPFPRNVTDAIRGDFVNLRITADLDLDSVYGNLTDGEEDGAGPPPELPGPGGPEVPGLPDLPGLPEPDLPGVPDLPDPNDPGPLPGLPDPDPDPEPDPDPDPDPTDPDGPGLICPPLCTGTHAGYSGTGGGNSGYPAGVNAALAELMTRGLFR